MKDLYVIAGPTAGGKTAAAVELAKIINGEVVSADSMQIYKEMDIGTAKPTVDEMDGIPHHMIDIISPGEAFSAADYKHLAAEAIEDIRRRGKTPILAGGTGFYINAVIFDTNFTKTKTETENQLRQEFAEVARCQGVEALHEKLKQADPKAAEAIHPNNVKRVARALSYCVATGQLFSAHNAFEKTKQHNSKLFILSHPRESLYSRINARVISMWRAGLLDEVKNLLNKGYNPSLTAMQGIGYKETVAFLNNQNTEAETIAIIQQATRNYAKRQETWFRNSTKAATEIKAENKTPIELAATILETG